MTYKFVTREDIDAIDPETSLGHLGAFMDLKTVALKILTQQDAYREVAARFEEIAGFKVDAEAARLLEGKK